MEKRITRGQLKIRETSDMAMCEDEPELALVIPSTSQPPQCTPPPEVALQPLPPPPHDISAMVASLQPMAEAPRLDFRALVSKLPGELNVDNL